MKNKSLIEKIGKGIVKKGLGLAIAGSLAFGCAGLSYGGEREDTLNQIQEKVTKIELYVKANGECDSDRCMLGRASYDIFFRDTQYGREFNFQNYGFCGIEDASTIHDVNMDGLRKLNGFDANYNDNISVIRSIENSKIERIDANVEQEKLDEANKIYNKFLDKLLGDLGL